MTDADAVVPAVCATQRRQELPDAPFSVGPEEVCEKRQRGVAPWHRGGGSALMADPRWKPAQGQPGVALWTDNFSSILSVFKWV